MHEASFLYNKKTTFQPNMQLVSAYIYLLGILAAFAIVLVALYLVAYLLNLVIRSICEIGADIQHVFASSSAPLQLFILLLAFYGGYRLFKLVRRSL